MPILRNFASPPKISSKKRRAAAGGVSGKLFMWGSNTFGQLGVGDTEPRSSPTQVGSLTAWSKASTGNATLAVKNNGELWSWGFGSYGGLGLGNTTSYQSPKQIGALTNWATPVMDQDNSGFCLKTDGTLWCWGSNTEGQLGNNNKTAPNVGQRSSPVQLGSSTWAKLSVGSANVLAVDSAGKLFAWGKNQWGQLGLGDTTYRSSPVQVGALTNWKTPSLTAVNVLCTKTDGTLWAWGRSTSGQLGLGNTTNYSSPVQIGSLTTWDVPSTGNGYVSMCVKTDNTLWIWGSGGNGKLGRGNTTSYSSPVQVGALTNWATPSSFSSSSMCSKTDGTLWSWGGQSSGQLGLGNTTDFSSPVQIGSLTTWAVTLGKNTTAGCLQTP
jgi:alpha-tubulin suppressor-like RCC1 family protein